MIVYVGPLSCVERRTCITDRLEVEVEWGQRSLVNSPLSSSYHYSVLTLIVYKYKKHVFNPLPPRPNGGNVAVLTIGERRRETKGVFVEVTRLTLFVLVLAKT